MRSVSLSEAKRHLSRLAEDAACGQEIVITRRGLPVARLVALPQDVTPKADAQPRQFGQMKGKIWIADDFDAPLPDDLLAAFEGDP